MALPSPWLYVATAEARDSEMAERVAAHQARRGPSWTTVETPRDIAGALAANANTPALVDCLTLWLSNVLLADADVDAEIEHLDGALARAGRHRSCWSRMRSAPALCPTMLSRRRFRDLQGLLNQRIAARADRVFLVVAGLPLTLKGSP